MSRWVTAAPPTGRDFEVKSEEGAKGKKDGAIERIAKYVPAEILAGFTALYSALIAMALSDNEKLIGAAILIALFFIVTIFYVIKNTPDNASKKAHLAVTPLAFLAWSYAISSAVLGDYYLPLFAFIAQAVVIALSIIVKPGEG
ncbi:hypothetical protein [Maritalea mediterranea]|uniref:Uncharacterized protein n=1 Tax=Maritalea mediterranea TaxID=2909667 RepID=A0ABS9E9F6_9HYPH|nr:hypothetical protein [Maritalea mediterranea]MCF4099515.1 hypothetical protein [Maritalea mediterranea]